MGCGCGGQKAGTVTKIPVVFPGGKVKTYGSKIEAEAAAARGGGTVKG